MAAINAVMPVRMCAANKARTTSVRSLASPAAMAGKALRFNPLRYFLLHASPRSEKTGRVG